MMIVNHDAKGSDFHSQNFILCGLSCPTCEVAVELKVIGLDGVLSVRADSATERLHCEIDPTLLDTQTLIHTLNELGYILRIPSNK